MNGKFAHERIGLGQAVEVEHREPVLLAEPADRLGVERLAGAEQTIRNFCGIALPASPMAIIARIAVGRREDVRDLVAAEEVELLGRVEAALALEDALQRAEPPRPEQRRDARGPGPLAHAVEALAVLDVVAVDELLVGEDVAVGVDDALRDARSCRTCSRAAPGRRRRCRRVRSRSAGRRAARVEDEHLLDPRGSKRGAFGSSVTSTFGLRVASAGGGCRRRRRAPTSTAGSRRASTWRRRPPPSRASAAARPRRGPRARRRGAQQCAAWLERSCSSPQRQLAPRAVVALPDHRGLSRGCLSQTSCGDVVALGHAPLVLGAQLVVRGRGARCHGSPPGPVGAAPGVPDPDVRCQRWLRSVSC